MSLNSGTLWIVATPLGNLGDLSPRARETLAEADGILAEDTRRAGALLARCGIAARGFTSFHDHNEEARLGQTVARLKGGQSLALVSDAGTPLLSDPGYRLVKVCREEGIRVVPVPGPCAPVAALSASGLPPYPFVFLGFVPRKATEREAFFMPFIHMGATLAFFERKDRLAATLECAYRVLGRRQACIARELTKTHEEFLSFFLDESAALPDELLGEITVLVGPPLEEGRTPEREAERILEEESALGGKAKEVVRRAQSRLRGWSGKELYARLPGIARREDT